MENIVANGNDLLMVLPVLVLLITGLELMLLDAFKVRKYLPWVAAAGIGLSMILALPPVLEAFADPQAVSFSGMYRTDALSSMVHIFLCASGLFTIFFVGDFMKRQEAKIPDVYSLIVFSLIGMVLLANANDLIITFIGLETMSICLYVMATMYKKDVRANESGLKYFLLGAFATGFFVYGIALIYGATGTTNFSAMDVTRLATSDFFYPGVGLLVIGFLFKVSAFPFHAWTPDVYSGTPTPLAGFMSTGSKSAAFIALAIFMNTNAVIAADEKFQTVIIVCALLTMVYGNIVAARQSNIKRMLAYSSIAHSGYVMLALTAGPQGVQAVIFYMFIYTLMNIGAFGLVSMAESRMEDNNLESWKGFGRANPWLGAALTIFLFSLAGIPPLAGFMGKYFVFAAAINAGIVVPAVIGILTSVIGAYYYITVVKTMYFDDSAKPSVVTSRSMMPVATVVVLAVLVLLLGVYPALVQDHLATGVPFVDLPGISGIAP
ncbi:MAG: NADH-quinone oxidoreductase subunit N [Pseudomonadota bacterium]